MEHEWQKTDAGVIDGVAFEDFNIDTNTHHNGPRCKVCWIAACLPCCNDKDKDLWSAEEFPCPGRPSQGRIWTQLFGHEESR